MAARPMAPSRRAWGPVDSRRTGQGRSGRRPRRAPSRASRRSRASSRRPDAILHPMSSRRAWAMLVPIALAIAGCAGATPSISSAPAQSTATPASSGEACAGPAASPTSTGWWGDRVFYEVFVRSFADSDADGIGDLRGLIAHLDDLNDGDPATTNDLGVTGLWLMPIAESPSYHGYDVVDYRAVERDYGTTEDLRALLSAA